MDLALEFADRVIGIREGRVVYDGPVKEVTDDVLDIIYNGAPIPKVADAQCATDEVPHTGKPAASGVKEVAP